MIVRSVKILSLRRDTHVDKTESCHAQIRVGGMLDLWIPVSAEEHAALRASLGGDSSGPARLAMSIGQAFES